MALRRTKHLTMVKPILVSADSEPVASYFYQWLGDRVVRPYRFSKGSIIHPVLKYPANQPGALYDEFAELAHEGCGGIIDLSSHLAQHGFIDYVRKTHPDWPILSPTMRGVALETVREVGQSMLKYSLYHSPRYPNQPYLTVPKHEVCLIHPTGAEQLRLFKEYGPRVVLKQETGMDTFRVRFASTFDQFRYLLDEMRYPLQVQSYVEGIEIAFYAMVIGPNADIVPLATLFEHKKALTGDYGALTGEMGTIVLEYFSPAAMHLFESMRPSLRGRCYTGPLEINTRYDPETNEWVFLEFTCRQSDPGWQILSGLFVQDGMAGVWEDWLQGKPTRPYYTKPCAVGVCLAGAGYPHDGGCIQGVPIHLETVSDDRMRIEAMNVTMDEQGRWFTAGGRHVLVVGQGHSVPEARDRAYGGAQAVKFFGCQYRLDIAAKWESWVEPLVTAGLLDAVPANR